MIHVLYNLLHIYLQTAVLFESSCLFEFMDAESRQQVPLGFFLLISKIYNSVGRKGKGMLQRRREHEAFFFSRLEKQIKTPSKTELDLQQILLSASGSLTAGFEVPY